MSIYPSGDSMIPNSTPPLSIPAGIVIGLLASFVQSLGLTIQRKSHVIDQLLPEHRRTIEHRRPLWLLGFAIFISSNLLGSLVQIASLPVVILAPLGAVSLLWNAFFARLILGDRFSPWMILGTILIAGGAILIAVYGIVPEPTRSLEDLLELFRRPAFAAYFSTLAFVVVLCLAFTHITEFALTRKLEELSPTEVDDLVLTPTANDHIIDLSQTSSAIGAESHDELDHTEHTPLLVYRKASTVNPSNSHKILKALNRTRLLVAISYASFSGILSGMCLIFAKSGVELLLLTLRGKNQFWRWEAWVLLLGLGVFALLQLWYLHKALILADPTLVCPSAFCFYNLSSIVNGMVYFNQVSLILPLHLALVILGIFILLGGVWVVSIQAGGGGVDLGPWSEETHFPESGDRLCEEPISEVYENITSIDEEGQEVALSQPSKSRDVRIGPVPLERETRSDSSITSPMRLSMPTSQSPIEFLEQDHSRRRNSLLSTSTGRRPTLEAHSTLPISPTYHTRYALRHRLTANDLYKHSRGGSHSMHYPTGNGVGSTGLSMHHHGTMSPPINPVSTLGSGLQIGLSPMSPGFTITPRERKPRVSGLGGRSPDLERNRRRTVSEGDVNGHVAMRYENMMEDGEVDEGGGRQMLEGDLVLPLASLQGNEEPDHGRWGWIRRLVSRGRV